MTVPSVRVQASAWRTGCCGNAGIELSVWRVDNGYDNTLAETIIGL